MRRALTLIAAAAFAAAAILIWTSRREPEPIADPTAAVAALTPAEALSAAPSAPGQAPPPEDSVVVRFEDGTEVPIRVGFVWPLPSTVDRRLPARDQYAILRPLADAGDAAAARTLFQVLDRCQREVERGSQPRDFCEGITPERMAESLDWLLRAAKGGDYDAGRWWAERLGDSQEGYEAWEARWRQGDPLALMALLRHYERGVPASTGGAPDPVHAHAYRLVDFHVREAVYANFKGLNTARALHADSVRMAGGRLSPQQYAEAQELAKQILVANPNCCRGIW